MLSRVEEVITGVLFMYCATLLAASCTSSKSTSISLEAILYNLNWEIKILRVYLKVKTWEVFLCFLAIIFLGPVVLTSQWRLSWVSQVFTPRMSKNWLEFLYAIVGHQYQPSLHSGIQMAIRLFTVPAHSLKFPMKAKDPRNANQLERQLTRTDKNRKRICDPLPQYHFYRVSGCSHDVIRSDPIRPRDGGLKLQRSICKIPLAPRK